MWINGKLNKNILAKSAFTLCKKIDLKNDHTEKIKFLIVEEQGIGTDYPFSGEKLSPVLSIYKAEDFNDAKKWGSKIITDQKMMNMSAKEILKDIPKNSYVYLTLDLDGLNPKEFPAVETRSPGGPGVSKIVEIIMEIAKSKKFVGANVVEFAPKKDINNLSLTAAIRLIALLFQVLNR